MKLFKFICTLLFITLLSACHAKDDVNTVKVGIIDGPSTAMWEAAQKVALNKYHLNIILVKFSDYNLPNEALNNGDIDANAFQHKPFLDAQIQARGYDIIPIANTFLYPLAMYSDKIKKLSQLKAGDKIAIPNDPSNEARALMLLQQAGLIKLQPGININATTLNILANPQSLQFIELDAAQLPRALNDVTTAVINNDFAQPAGLNPKNALIVESKQSPYMNIIVIRSKDKGSTKIDKLIKSFQTDAVRDVANAVSDGNAVAGW